MNSMISFNDVLLQNMIDEAVKKALSDSKINESEKNCDVRKKLVSREELVKSLNVSNGWIYIQMRDMKMPYHRQGRRLFFDMDEIRDFLMKERKNG